MCKQVPRLICVGCCHVWFRSDRLAVIKCFDKLAFSFAPFQNYCNGIMVALVGDQQQDHFLYILYMLTPYSSLKHWCNLIYYSSHVMRSMPLPLWRMGILMVQADCIHRCIIHRDAELVSVTNKHRTLSDSNIPSPFGQTHTHTHTRYASTSSVYLSWI